MRKLLFAVTVVVIGLSACQKEGSLETTDPGTGGGGTGGSNSANKLVRTGTRAGADSITADYTYNSNNRITQISYSGSINGQPLTLQQKVNRNASNIITSVVLKSPLLLAAGLDRDSLVTVHTYDASASRYKYSVSKYIAGGDAFSDSTVYSYDGNGKLTSQIAYFSDGTGYLQDSKIEYTYTGNNLLTAKSYVDEGNGFVLDQTETFEYDNKVNPMQSAADAPILGMSDFYSANNRIKNTTVTTDPPQTQVSNVTYTYNTNDRPTRAVGTAGSSTSTIHYYYQ